MSDITREKALELMQQIHCGYFPNLVCKPEELQALCNAVRADFARELLGMDVEPVAWLTKNIIHKTFAVDSPNSQAAGEWLASFPVVTTTKAAAMVLQARRMAEEVELPLPYIEGGTTEAFTSEHDLFTAGQVRKAIAAALVKYMQGQEPMFWYRPCSDGCYEGPIHNAQIERVRKESGSWVPLYSAPSQQEERVRELVDVMDTGQQSLQLVFKSREAANRYKADIVAARSKEQGK